MILHQAVIKSWCKDDTGDRPCIITATTKKDPKMQMIASTTTRKKKKENRE